MTIGEKIALIRDRLGLKQIDLANDIGISKGAVSQIESGNNNPSERTLRLICSVYNVNYRWLKEAVVTDPDSITKEDFTLTPVTDDDLVERVMFGENEFAKSVMREFAKLGDAEWRMLEKLVKNIAASLPKEEDKKEK